MNIVFKRILVTGLLFAILFSLSACTNEKAPVELTVENFDEYFFTQIKQGDVKEYKLLFQEWGEFSYRISFDLKQSAKINNITIKGRYEIDVPKTHALYTKGKVPIEFSVFVTGNGHGETEVSFSIPLDSIEDYSWSDCYIVIENVTGTVTPW